MDDNCFPGFFLDDSTPMGGNQFLSPLDEVVSMANAGNRHSSSHFLALLPEVAMTNISQTPQANNSSNNLPAFMPTATLPLGPPSGEPIAERGRPIFTFGPFPSRMLPTAEGSTASHPCDASDQMAGQSSYDPLGLTPEMQLSYRMFFGHDPPLRQSSNTLALISRDPEMLQAQTSAMHQTSFDPVGLQAPLMQQGSYHPLGQTSFDHVGLQAPLMQPGSYRSLGQTSFDPVGLQAPLMQQGSYHPLGQSSFDAVGQAPLVQQGSYPPLGPAPHSIMQQSSYNPIDRAPPPPPQLDVQSFMAHDQASSAMLSASAPSRTIVNYTSSKGHHPPTPSNIQLPLFPRRNLSMDPENDEYHHLGHESPPIIPDYDCGEQVQLTNPSLDMSMIAAMSPSEVNWEAIAFYLAGQVRHDPDERIYRCYKCSTEFVSPQAYGGHMSKHSKRPRRIACGESSSWCTAASQNMETGTPSEKGKMPVAIDVQKTPESLGKGKAKVEVEEGIPEQPAAQVEKRKASWINPDHLVIISSEEQSMDDPESASDASFPNMFHVQTDGAFLN